MKKGNTKLTYTYRNTHAIEIFGWVGGGGVEGEGSNFTLKNVGFLLCILLLTRGFFYCQRNLWFGAHIDTGVIDFLNDSGCIFVEFVLHCSLKLLFEQQKTDTKIRNGWYLQYHECKDIYQKGYQ